METVDITVIHQGQTLHCALRKGLGLQVLAKHTSWLEFDCRSADCGICLVKVRDGAASLSQPTANEADFLRAMRADPDERLACQCRVFGPLAIEIDAR